MKDEWPEYVAAGLLDCVTSPKVWKAGDLANVFKDTYKIDVDTDTIIKAAKILMECNLSFADTDPYAGSSVKIYKSRVQDFLRYVNLERDPSFTVPEDESHSILTGRITRVRRTPNLNAYNRYRVLRRYLELGEEFIADAMEAISRGGIATRAAPASDRVVSLNHNQTNYHDIERGFDQAIEIAQRSRPNSVSGDEHVSIVAGLKAARELWKSCELTELQYRVGILMAVERAEAALQQSFTLVKGPLLMEALKAFWEAAKERIIQ
ncbi:hypothetical protein AAG604_03275 [Citromicrobium bathyomarinum]